MRRVPDWSTLAHECGAPATLHLSSTLGAHATCLACGLVSLASVTVATVATHAPARPRRALEELE